MNLFHIGELRVAEVLGAPLQETPQVALTDAACISRIGASRRPHGELRVTNCSLRPQVPLSACLKQDRCAASQGMTSSGTWPHLWG